MRWLRRIGYGLLALLVVGAAAYWWLVVETHSGPAASYPIDLAEIRRLAGSIPGQTPRVIRVETMAELSAPKAFVVAGDGWQSLDLSVSAYELDYGDRATVLDTGVDADIARFMSATSFDAAAYARVSGALAHAALIIVTHEHPDHVGGLLAQPNRKHLLAATRLTREQLTVLQASLDADAFAVLHLPQNLFRGYRPIDYVRYLAIAPGVVLIKSPGHTPGSQMVYVRRADGIEYLFTGDVAWRMRNIETSREKARLVSWMSGEDRGPVRDELDALNRLHADHPELHMLPGHDGPAIASLANAGLLVRGF